MSVETRTRLDAFRRTVPFELDPFQVEAIQKLGTHNGVLVSAPTSSGKTVVADYAIFEALEDGVKAIYTTPLKALSNQKFRDLKKRYGDGYVGLVTGEHTINPSAPVVVMTTEILRNLIYDDPDRLRDVRYVILDEVHYIDDYPRGAVWEEVMIQAPSQIHFVGLSATISNYQQVADWMGSHRGKMGVVSVTKRPTELRLWLAMENRVYQLFDEQGRVVRATLHKAQGEVAADHRFDRSTRAGRRFEAPGRRLDSNSLTRVIEGLHQQQMLPAIYFIFSRRGCEEAMQRCAMHGLDLTSADEKARIAEFVAGKMSEVTEKDEAALYRNLLNHEMLAQGISVHHAGLLPFLKELVEELFLVGLVKVVFATETLSLGIHMPARSVVISSFTKFDGRGFPSLTSGQLTQLLGRAGRRGIDKVGHGVILKDPEVDIGVIYEAAMGEDMVVESKFAPNYNMALNLLRNRDLAEAELLMERCFGQFQRRQAAEQRRGELANLEERLADLEKMADQPVGKESCGLEEVQQYFADEVQLRTLRDRVRRAKRDHYHRGESGLTKEQLAGTAKRIAEIESRHQGSPVRRCPNLRQHRTWQAEIWGLKDEIRRSQNEIDAAMQDYTRHLHSIIRVLEEAGFLYGMKPSEKGLLASRIYGENSLILSEALYQGWLDHLDPPELCAVLVMLAAEDRGRAGRRGSGQAEPYARNRFPSTEVRELFHSLKSLHFRFTELEEAYGEQTLRPLSRDYVDFAYRWARGDALDQIPLPPVVEFGDAIKAIRSLYSTLRQLEWAIPAETPLRATVYSAMRAMERDLIRRV